MGFHLRPRTVYAACCARLGTGIRPEDKKSIFLDDPNAAHTTDPREHEANTWAGNWLIPEQQQSFSLEASACAQPACAGSSGS